MNLEEEAATTVQNIRMNFRLFLCISVDIHKFPTNGWLNCVDLSITNLFSTYATRREITLGFPLHQVRTFFCIFLY
jgi:hypothetical protein